VKELLLPARKPVSLETRRWATAKDTELLDLLAGRMAPCPKEKRR